MLRESHECFVCVIQSSFFFFSIQGRARTVNSHQRRGLQRRFHRGLILFSYPLRLILCNNPKSCGILSDKSKIIWRGQKTFRPRLMFINQDGEEKPLKL